VSVAVVDTGTANLASICAGLTRAGAEPRLVADARAVEAAALLVLPGVGAFGSGMERLRERGLVAAVAARVAAERPLLAVCLGLQLLCCESEESPGVAGVGALDARVERFRGAPSVPQLGWNLVEPRGCELVVAGHAYYANSYRVGEPPAGWAHARTVHGEPFVAALERGPMLLCQFHPELSGAWGQALLGRWLARGAAC
jgi:imidazole glycerol phosphate synthase glutamine amidotransferase subunit